MKIDRDIINILRLWKDAPIGNPSCRKAHVRLARHGQWKPLAGITALGNCGRK